jgi:hypothetical protein
MINDQEFLHGAAFLRLIDHGEQIKITHISWVHPSIYLVDTDNSKSAILFKVSKKPKSAWSFTLSSQEESALDVVHSKYNNISVFLALICHKDGICCIAKKRLWTVLDENIGIAGQHISVSRKLHGSYHVSGPGRQRMDQTVPQNDWPRVIFSK